jgi:hypothetical protein
MDEMKLRLSTKFMRGIVSKLMAKAIYKKYGYKVDIQLSELDVSFIDGEAEIEVNAAVRLDSKEFMKIIKSTGLD